MVLIVCGVVYWIRVGLLCAELMCAGCHLTVAAWAVIVVWDLLILHILVDWLGPSRVL